METYRGGKEVSSILTKTHDLVTIRQWKGDDVTEYVQTLYEPYTRMACLNWI